MNKQSFKSVIAAQRVAPIAVAVCAVLAAGCASNQNAALVRADKVYAEASAEPTLMQNEKSAEYMKAADAALAKAKHNDDLIRVFGEPVDPREVDAQAYVAEQNVLAAKAAASSVAADAQIAQLTTDRDRALLAKNERDAAEKARLEAERLAQAERDKRAADLTAALERAKQRGAEVETTAGGILVTFRKVTFDSNKTDVKPEFQKDLDDLAAALTARYPQAKLEIRGHTDSTGPEPYNAMLSEQRAAAVKTFLIGKGLPADRVATRGIGEQNPVASNATPEGRAQNRRVELAITGIEGQ